VARTSGRALIVRDAAGTALEVRPCARVFREPRARAVRVRSLSNGVAVHTSWAAARAAALGELVERDRGLRPY
jgi:ribosomal protein S12 methylthiotransferase accessory factor YcaO